MTILYVDDEQDNLLVFRANFRNEFRVVTATSASDALALLESTEVDIILSDNRMPGMSGIDFLEIVKGKYANIIRILMTAAPETDAVDAINRAGIYYFVRKPWDASELKLLLQKAAAYYTVKKRNLELTDHLLSAMRDLQIFFYRSFHELKGPVASQKGILDLLKQEESAGEVAEFIDMLEQSTTALEHALEKIQQLNETGNASPTYEPIHLSPFIEGVCARFADDLQQLGIHLLVNVADTPEFVFDAALLKIVVESLVDNSIHALEKVSRERIIDISVQVRDADMHFVVKDTGVGITPEELDKIFSPFFKGTAVSFGTGLGLYVVKRIVDRYHGQLQVTSSPDTGTTIDITLPVARPEAA